MRVRVRVAAVVTAPSILLVVPVPALDHLGAQLRGDGCPRAERLLRVLEQPVISAHDLAQSRADMGTRRSRVLERVWGYKVRVRVRVRVIGLG